MAKVAMERGVLRSFEAVNPDAWIPTLIFIVLAPLLGLVFAYALMTAIYWVFRNSSPKRMDVWFRKLQLLSAAIFSYAHGTNDAQKTMGIITGVLFAAGYVATLDVPVPVIFAAHAAIGLGTLSGGWRIVRTMGGRLTRLKPRGGFAAETSAAVSILISSELGMPVSTTHVIAGAIAGVGSIQRLKAVRWGLATTIVWAWVLTIPASAAIGAASLLVIRLFVTNV
jgi:PiT family inorganic phosphate transporter